jgi:hypothetical protein
MKDVPGKKKRCSKAKKKKSKSSACLGFSVRRNMKKMRSKRQANKYQIRAQI